MENLFTNVPVLETINIIINDIYHHPTLPPFKTNSNTLYKILLLYTTEVPFYDPHGNIFIQKEGIALRSVLGTIFNKFYVSDLENKTFNTINKLNIHLTMYPFSLIALINLTHYERPFKIIPFIISHKKSISTIKSHRHKQY